MRLKATSVEDYLQQVPLERRPAFGQLRQVILDNIPDGYEECLSYGMIGYVVPHALYPDGYHCSPELPLPFVNIGNQKNYVSLYHSGLYAMPEILDWFVTEYPRHCSNKLDMGKCCVRFKNVNKIPFRLIGELMQKISVEKWIEINENRNRIGEK